MTDREEKRYKTTLENLKLLPVKDREKIVEFLDELNANDIGFNRRIQVGGQLKRISELLNGKFLSPEKKDIVNLMNQLKKESKKERTRNHYVITLKQFYKWLDGTRDPPSYVEWLQLTQIKPVKKDLLTRDEVIKLIDHMKNYRDKVITQLLFDTGARIGEVLAIKRRDIIFTDLGVEISIAGREEGARKTGSRDVFVVGDSIAMLQDYLKSRPMDEETYVFPMLYGNGNTQCNYDSYVKNLKKSMEESGLKKNVHAHLFRHSHASELAAKGVQQAVIEDQLGWSKASRTARFYIDVNTKDIKRAILKANGKEIPEEDGKPKEEMIMKTCPRCSTLNPSFAKRCSTCWLPFDINIALTEKEKVHEVSKATAKAIGGPIEDLLNSLDSDEIVGTLLALLKKKKEEGKLSDIADNL